MTRRESQFWCGAACLIVVALLVQFAILVRDARRAAQATAAKGMLNQLHLALHNYHDMYGQFPPAFVADETGKPMHSWRVLVLPFIDGKELYDAYRFDEPWNGPNNSKLANRMPPAFHSHSEPPSTTNTNAVVIVGPDTAFPGSRSTRLEDFKDGQENTILLTEIGNSTIPWLAPRDLSVETMSFRVQDKQKPSISSVSWRQPYVVFADRLTTFSLSDTLSPDELRALTTIAGGEPVTRESLESQGRIDRQFLLSR